MRIIGGLGGCHRGVVGGALGSIWVATRLLLDDKGLIGID